MSDSRVHIAMDGHSYMEFFQDQGAPGQFRAVFHPGFDEKGIPLQAVGANGSNAAGSRLGRLLQQLMRSWLDDDSDKPATGAF